MRLVRVVLTYVISVLTFVVALAVLPVAPAIAVPVLGALAGAGERAGATRLSFPAGDSVSAQVDVGSGNLLVSVKSLALPDVNGQLQLGAFYNSAVGRTDTTLPRLGARGWGLDYTDDVRMVAETSTPATSAVTYRAPGGLVGVFTPIAGSSNPVRYTAPAGFKSVLTYDAAGYKLVDSVTQQTRLFTTAGLLSSVKDRNGNTTTISGTTTVTVRTAASTLEPSTAVITKPTSTQTRVKQGSATSLRTNTFATSGETLATFTDALGRVTTFTYTATTGAGAGQLTKITAPGNVVTAFGYDTAGRVTSVDEVDRTAGNNVTRLAYTTVGGAPTTYVADPTTNQTTSPGVVPHTTYTLNATQRVTRVVDAAGRERSSTYTPDFDAATATTGPAAGGDTTTNTYGANTGQSLTKTAASTGASSSLSYANASGPAQYLPTGSTDDAGNSSLYTYNGPGNQLTSTTAGNAQAQVSYNTDGTVATATSPGNGANVTTYGYTNKQLTSITPVTGTSLGNRALTYDSMGRLATSTNGRGITTTYTYDVFDRITKVAFTYGDQVTYGYDTAGRLSTRTDPNGTVTTWTYDDLGRLTSRENTTGGGAITYGYDKASRMTTSTSPVGGTVTYRYDRSGLPTTISYPSPTGGTDQLTLAYDAQARLTSTTLADTADSGYAGRAVYGYTTSGKVASVTADTSANAENVIDLTYCYTAGTTPAGGCTASATNDRAKLQWRKDNLQNIDTTYTYDTSGRLTQAAGDYGNTRTYTYDSRNNRTTATPVPRSTTGTQTFSFNAANQIVYSGHNYDGAGNMNNDSSDGATNIGYTAADQLRELTTPAGTFSFKHAGVDQNELLKQESGSGTYEYTYGRTNAYGLPVVEQFKRTFTNNGTTVVNNTSFINNPLTGQPLVQRTSSGAQNMYVYDGTPGAPLALLTTDGGVQAARRYDPYGVPIASQTDTSSEAFDQDPFEFAGNGVYIIATAWVHYGARYYSPTLGTFTQQDTIDAPLDPLNANRYAFAGGDPINNIDPTGRSVFGVVKCAAAIGVAVASVLVPASKAYKAIKGLGGVKNTAYYLVKAGSPQEFAKIAGTGGLSAAVSILAIDEITDQCF